MLTNGVDLHLGSSTERIREVATSIGHRRVLVVTDRYPPDSHGGAELSLHIVLRTMPVPEEILVVTSTGTNGTVGTYTIDGIQVLVLPAQMKWPHHARFEQSGELGNTYERVLGRAQRRVSSSLSNAAATSEEAQADRALIADFAAEHQPRGGVPRDFVELRDGATVSALREVAKICRPRLVHADNYRSIVFAAQAMRGLDASLVGVVRDNRFGCVRHSQSMMVKGSHCDGCDLACAEIDLPDMPARLRQLLERTQAFRTGALRRLDRVIVTSRFLERQIGELVPSSRITRISNASGCEAEAASAMRGVAERVGTHLLIVGMLTENKGQAEFIKRLRRLTELVPDVFVHLAGRGARMEKAIRRIAAESGHPERVLFHGYLGRERLFELYRECQIVVLPTRWPEPFGRVPLEAGLVRRPSVAFAVGGLKESIVDGETGVLVPPNDYPALLGAIEKLARDPSRRQRYGRAAYERVHRHYDREALAEELKKVWAEVTDSHRATA